MHLNPHLITPSNYDDYPPRYPSYPVPMSETRFARRSGLGNKPRADHSAAATSLLASYSGGSGGSYDNCFDIDLCPDLLLAGLALAGAGAFLALYMSITMVPSRRRRRALGSLPITPSVGFDSLMKDTFWAGMARLVVQYVSCPLDLLTPS